MPVSPSDLKVLVVDDHMIIRQVVEQNLRAMGFSQIETAADCGEAQDKFEESDFNIVFVDWILPGKSGYTMMQEYREDRKYDDVAFVMVTSESDERHMIEALKAGATSYIVKPVTQQLFKDKVEKVLEWLNKRQSGGKKQSG